MTGPDSFGVIVKINLPPLLSINAHRVLRVSNRGAMKNEIGVVSVVRWLARGLAVCLFLFWGAFFVEHVQEWFIAPFPNHPPLKVCVSVAWHGLLLAGLLIGWRRELTGCLTVLIAGGVFFYGAAGRMFPVFYGVMALPALLWLWCWWQTRRRVVASVAS